MGECADTEEDLTVRTALIDATAVLRYAVERVELVCIQTRSVVWTFVVSVKGWRQLILPPFPSSCASLPRPCTRSVSAEHSLEITL